MKQALFLVTFSLACISPLWAQNYASKPWTEWDKKQVDKILNNSPWGQTQSESDISRLMGTSPSRQQGSGDNAPIGPGGSLSTGSPQTDARIGSGLSQTGAPAVAGGTTWNFRIRFLSAKPVREAFARRIILADPKTKVSDLEDFINTDYSDSIVIAVTWDGGDRSYTGIVERTFNVATTATIKNGVFLVRRDGKRIEIDEYEPPTPGGTGAKFVFPKVVAGKPFVNGNDELLHFIADMGRNVKVIWKFKLSDMVYHGKLEY